MWHRWCCWFKSPVRTLVCLPACRWKCAESVRHQLQRSFSNIPTEAEASSVSIVHNFTSICPALHRLQTLSKPLKYLVCHKQMRTHTHKHTQMQKWDWAAGWRITTSFHCNNFGWLQFWEINSYNSLYTVKIFTLDFRGNRFKSKYSRLRKPARKWRSEELTNINAFILLSRINYSSATFPLHFSHISCKITDVLVGKELREAFL